MGAEPRTFYTIICAGASVIIKSIVSIMKTNTTEIHECLDSYRATSPVKFNQLPQFITKTSFLPNCGNKNQFHLNLASSIFKHTSRQTNRCDDKQIKKSITPIATLNVGLDRRQRRRRLRCSNRRNRHCSHFEEDVNVIHITVACLITAAC